MNTRDVRVYMTANELYRSLYIKSILSILQWRPVGVLVSRVLVSRLGAHFSRKGRTSDIPPSAG